MHEMALVRNVVDIVVDQAKMANAPEVCAVHLVIGEGRDIVQEYFDGLFAHLARGTVAEHAKLFITRTPLAAQCGHCGHTFPVVGSKRGLVCPSCGTEKNYRLVSGMEFKITNIEVGCAIPVAGVA